MVEERVKSCLACQVATPEAAREPLQMSTLPDQAWEEISVDFAELSTGDYLLVVSDDYSRYPIVEVIRSAPKPLQLSPLTWDLLTERSLFIGQEPMAK